MTHPEFLRIRTKNSKPRENPRLSVQKYWFNTVNFFLVVLKGSFFYAEYLFKWFCKDVLRYSRIKTAKRTVLGKNIFCYFRKLQMYVTHLMLQLCPIPLVKGSMAPKRINQGLLLYNIFANNYFYIIYSPRISMWINFFVGFFYHLKVLSFFGMGDRPSLPSKS